MGGSYWNASPDSFRNRVAANMSERHSRPIDTEAPTDQRLGWRFDAVFTALALWMVAGVTWDFAFHQSGISFEEEGFLTVPHAVFYTAFLAIVVLFGTAILRNRSRGASWLEAIPFGYGYGVLGVALFAIGGPMDVLWHQAFGAEAGIEALVSPTHLLLATGAVLFFSSPLRAAWIRGVEPSLIRQLPMLFSAGFVAISIAAFAMYGNPLVEPVATGALDPGHGVLSIVMFSVLIVGVALSLVGRFRLAPGAFVFLFSFIAVPFSYSDGLHSFFPAMVTAGLIADGYNTVLQPAPSEPLRFRGFAVVLTLTLFGGYFLSHRLIWGLEWSTHIWAGALFAAVLVGILVSYLVNPYSGSYEP